MNRLHALVFSVLVALVAVAGGYATIHTINAGTAATRPEVATEAAIKARSARLDKWAASLKKALRSRPPALPPIPTYARIQTVGALGSAALPKVTRAAAPPRAVASTHAVRTAPERSATHETPIVQGRADTSADEPGRADDKSAPNPPTTTAAAAHAPAPSPPTPPPAAPKSAPTPAAPPAPAPAPAPKTTQPSGASVEAQCDALERAAEGQGEAAKRAAEQQCEALKQAAEHNGSDD